MDEGSKSSTVALEEEHSTPKQRNATREDPFGKSARIPRSPPTVARFPTPTEEAKRQPEKPTTARRIFAKDTVSENSPQLEVFTDDRESVKPSDTVEGEMRKCRQIVIKMRNATERQKNISMEVKKGLSELEESLDTIRFLMKTREPAKRDQGTQTTPPTNEETVGKNNKRPPSSPPEKHTERKKRQARASKTPRTSLLRPSQNNAPTATTSKNSTKETAPQKEIPTEQKEAKKAHASNEEEKKPRSRRMLRSRPEAILIKPTGKQTYAEILREIRSKANPDKSETQIKTVRQTKAGHMLLELAAKSKGKDNFSSSLKSILGEKADICHLEPRTTLEIRDMDEFTSEEEVETAVKLKLSDPGLNLQVTLTKVNSRAQKMAIIHLNARAANELLQDPRIKIGWIYCRVRPRVVVTRCYRCLGYGHQQATCNGVNRRGLCFNCGEQGHKKEECRATAKCCLCTEIGLTPDLLAHVPGSGTCRVFRDALEKAKERASL